jgi:hypothetical protein
MILQNSEPDPEKVILQITGNGGNLEENRGEAFRSLMEFYESSETVNDEENEVDLISQVLDITNSYAEYEY